ncbi:MAG: hypothetical protein RQM92_06335 [Candidatus Syntrophopropionicum ammoniitolerans]
MRNVGRLANRFLLLIFALVLLFSPVLCFAAPLDEITPEGLTDPLELNDVQSYIDQLDSTVKGVVPQLDFRDMVVKLVKGELDWKPADILHNMVSMLFKEVVANFALLGKLVVLAVICAVLQNLVCSFEKGDHGAAGLLRHLSGAGDHCHRPFPWR